MKKSLYFMKKGNIECKKQFFKGNRLNFFMTLLTILLYAAMNIAMAFMLKYFIESVEKLSNQLLRRGLIITGSYMLTYAVIAVYMRNYKNRYLRTALSQYKDCVFSKMLNKSISEFRGGVSSRLISAFSNDLHSIENHYLIGSLDLIRVVLAFVAAAVVMIMMNWMVGLTVTVVCIISTLFSLKYGKKLVKKESETSDQNRGFVAQVKDFLDGFIIIKSFKAEKEALEIFRQRNVELESTKQSRRVTSDTINIYSNISSIIVFTTIFTAGFYLAFRGDMTIGTVIALIQLGNYILTPVVELAPLISNRRAAVELINRIEKEVEEKETEADTGIQIAEFKETIVFKDVCFSYENDNLALADFSYVFEKGKNYAIVGSSGSGKSTILKLILGYYNEYDGDILIDGVPLREINLDSLYDQISIIQQDVFLFDSSIENNITMFQSFDEAKLSSAIERAGLLQLIKEKGRDYSCGEGGKNLSGGEKQRISIARSLIRDTPILLMDEATSGLDNETALNVENAVLDIEGMTRIIVTHRFNESTMKKYDKILVMNRGRLIEHGTFDELMEDKGYFYSLYNVSLAEAI
ncbi:MAG: ABC transporter ATP-binding protein [Caldicoprobacterales bacterium]